MKIRINTKKIKALNPCQDRLDNWMVHYPKFNGDIVEFLQLDNITHYDKIWVAMRVVSREILEIFTIDCAFSAVNNVNASYASTNAANCIAYAAADAADYADAAAYSVYAASDVDADRKIEQERQIDALIYLITTA